MSRIFPSDTPATPEPEREPALARVVSIREGQVWTHSLDWESALSRFQMMCHLYRGWNDCHISLENPNGVLVAHWENRNGRLYRNVNPFGQVSA